MLVKSISIDDGTTLWFRNDGTFSFAEHGDYKKGELYRYYRLPGYTSPRYIHRYVCRLFCPNPAPGLFNIVDHINHDKTDNRSCNLRWVDKQLNTMWKESLKPRRCKPSPQAPKKWLVLTSYEGTRVSRWFTDKKKAVEYKRAFRNSEFERIYQKKIYSYQHMIYETAAPRHNSFV
jgi:hypothetical protein